MISKIPMIKLKVFTILFPRSLLFGLFNVGNVVSRKSVSFERLAILQFDKNYRKNKYFQTHVLGSNES